MKYIIHPGTYVRPVYIRQEENGENGLLHTVLYPVGNVPKLTVEEWVFEDVDILSPMFTVSPEHQVGMHIHPHKHLVVRLPNAIDEDCNAFIVDRDKAMLVL